MNHDAFQRHLEMLLSYDVGAVFPACGTGELQSLSLDEYEEVVRATVEAVRETVPVVPGIGFGWGIAARMATIAQESGADGVLVFPPYLDPGDPSGQVEYFTRLAASVEIGVIVYQRDPLMFTPSAVARLAEVPNIVGLKDGTGRVELVRKQRFAVADPDFAFLNGVPTAELVASAMLGCGCRRTRLRS